MRRLAVALAAVSLVVAGLVVFLAAAGSEGVTGQAIGIGGDGLSLWTHPEETTMSYRDGGWSAAAIATTWAATHGRSQRPVGLPMPVPPA